MWSKTTCSRSRRPCGISRACHGDRAGGNACSHAPDDGVMRASVGAFAAAVLVAGCSSSTAGTSAPAAPPAATSPTPANAGTPATPTSTPVGGPLMTVGPGTYEVGTSPGQLAPGRYFSPGPPSGSPCYHARRRNNDSEPGDVIADELSQGQVIMTVRASDGYVEVSGCTFIAAS